MFSTWIANVCLEMQCVSSKHQFVFLLIAVRLTTGVSATLFFTKELVNSTWLNSDTKDAIYKENNVILICNASSDASSGILRIRLWDDPRILAHNTSSVLHYKLYNITCEQMGTYVCEDGLGRNRSLDIGVYNCEPMPCDGKNKSETIFIGFHETKTCTLCIIAYPDLSVSFLLNHKTLRTGRSENSIWNLSYHRVAFNKYLINITDANVSKEEDYGSHSLTIFSLQHVKKKLEYTIFLRRPGPPDCPTNLQATEQDDDNLRLSWQPGLDGGSSQWFIVSYTTKVKDAWTPYINETTRTSVKVTGLSENTAYTFRVEAKNTHHGRNTACQNNTVVLYTIRVPPPPKLSCPPVVEGKKSSAITYTVGNLSLAQVTSLNFIRSNSSTHATFCPYLPCSSSDGYQVTMINGTVSVLKIEQVTRADEGCWTCSFVFRNNVSRTSQCHLKVIAESTDSVSRIPSGVITGVLTGLVVLGIVAVVIMITLRRKNQHVHKKKAYSPPELSWQSDHSYRLTEILEPQYEEIPDNITDVQTHFVEEQPFPSEDSSLESSSLAKHNDDGYLKPLDVHPYDDPEVLQQTWVKVVLNSAKESNPMGTNYYVKYDREKHRSRQKLGGSVS